MVMIKSCTHGLARRKIPDDQREAEEEEPNQRSLKIDLRDVVVSSRFLGSTVGVVPVWL